MHYKYQKKFIKTQLFTTSLAKALLKKVQLTLYSCCKNAKCDVISKNPLQSQQIYQIAAKTIVVECRNSGSEKKF